MAFQVWGFLLEKFFSLLEKVFFLLEKFFSTTDILGSFTLCGQWLLSGCAWEKQRRARKVGGSSLGTGGKGNYLLSERQSARFTSAMRSMFTFVTFLSYVMSPLTSISQSEVCVYTPAL